VVTIRDVAKAAGVSAVTVSRVINGSAYVNAKTREKVEKAVRELGYLPNIAARSLRSRQTSTFALIVPDITNSFWTTVARGVEDAAHSAGYSIFLCNTDENLTKQENYIKAVLRQRVDGVIIAPFDIDAKHLAALRHQETPTVIIDRRVEGWEVDTVSSDSVAGAKALVTHLLNLGHQRIAIISGPPNTSTSEDRILGYRMALQEAGVEIDERLIRRGEFRSQTGYAQVKQMLEEGIEFSAIFGANNMIAMGALEALEEQGLSVPHDVALVCFDEVPDLARFFPLLTVAAQSAYHMGIHAAQLLLSRLNASVPLRPRHIVLPVRLILRYTCGRTLKSFSLPKGWLLPHDQITVETVLVQPIIDSQIKHIEYPNHIVQNTATPRYVVSDDHHRADYRRILKAIKFQETDRLPHFELNFHDKNLMEYVLERRIKVEGDSQRGLCLSPEDQIEFAQRVGIDAISCNFIWYPQSFNPAANHLLVSTIRKNCCTINDNYGAGFITSLTEQINCLERYLRAARDTSVGVVVSYPSILSAVLRATGIKQPKEWKADQQEQLNQMMFTAVEAQEKMLNAICDRFSRELLFILLRDEELVRFSDVIDLNAYTAWLSRLTNQAKEHGKLVGLYTIGNQEKLLPWLLESGIDIIMPVWGSVKKIRQLMSKWKGKFTLIGGINPEMLFNEPHNFQEEIRSLQKLCSEGGGFIVSTGLGIDSFGPPQQVIKLLQAVHYCEEC